MLDKIMVKKRENNKKKSIKNKFHNKLPGILWFTLGVIITLWTLLWLLISMNSNEISTVAPVILFGVGFYAMCIFILGTLVYYICRFIKKSKKKSSKKKKEKSKKKSSKKKKEKSKKKSSKKKKL